MAGLADLLHPNIPGAMQQGWAAGTQQRQVREAEQRQSRLAALASQAYTAPTSERPNLLAQMALDSPQAANQQNEQFHSDETRRNQKLVNMARYLKGVPVSSRAMVYSQQMAPELQKMGMSDFPATYDASTADQIMGTADALIAAYANAGDIPTQTRAFNAMTEGFSPEEREKAQRVAAGIAARPSSAAIVYREVTLPDGQKTLVALDPREVGGLQMGTGETFGSGVGSPAAQRGGDPFESLHATVPGLRVTSQRRTPEENARLPNSVPNSYHLTGDALDIGTPTPEQQAGLRQWAQANGFRIKNDYADGHWHLEPTRRLVGGNNAFLSPSDAVTTARTEAAKLTEQLRFLPEELRLRVESELAKQAGAAEIERANAREAKSIDAMNTLDLLAEAKRILPTATGSLAGSVRDNVSAAVGRSTEGARGTASLQAIAGQLIGKMPRFEGPQSDKDVLLYRQMAGDLANDKLPVDTRLAALATIEGLNEQAARQQALPPRYDYGNGGQAASPQQSARQSSGIETHSRAPSQIRSAQEWQALPSGTVYLDPQGRQRRKP